MGDKILKVIEAICGGVATFILLWVSIPHLFYIPKEMNGFISSTLLSMAAFLISIFMIFVYYYLLTRHNKIMSINHLAGDNVYKSTWSFQKVLIFLIFGLLFACYLVLYLFEFF